MEQKQAVARDLGRSAGNHRISGIGNGRSPRRGYEHAEISTWLLARGACLRLRMVVVLRFCTTGIVVSRAAVLPTVLRVLPYCL